mmetsp:Transcript_15661/g.28517  ORF Transcript_15661/g.28517 Transcript_15661/m.28517 type:complete len:209 (+) Transcript_15661:1262-1888(+)
MKTSISPKLRTSTSDLFLLSSSLLSFFTVVSMLRLVELLGRCLFTISTGLGLVVTIVNLLMALANCSSTTIFSLSLTSSSSFKFAISFNSLAMFSSCTLIVSTWRFFSDCWVSTLFWNSINFLLASSSFFDVTFKSIAKFWALTLKSVFDSRSVFLSATTNSKERDLRETSSAISLRYFSCILSLASSSLMWAFMSSKVLGLMYSASV